MSKMLFIIRNVTGRAELHCLRLGRFLLLGLALLIVWLLTGCSSDGRAVAADLSSMGDGAIEQTEAQALLDPETRVDGQGAVEVAVIPLEATSGRLAFQVNMNTHSVDLSMDLADLSSLETDAGLSLPALSWSGGSGHHVRGVLEFADTTPEGSPLLTGASQLKLIIRGVDAEQRVFVWDVR